MRIHAHAVVFAAVAPLMLFQSPTTSVFTDTKVSSLYETQQVTETHDSLAKSENHSDKTKKVAKKVTVTVKPGDSLSLIANAHHTSWVRLFNANKQVADPNIIHPGQKLTIPPADEKLPNRYKNLTQAQVSTMPALSSSDITYAATPRGGSANNTYIGGYCTWYVKQMRPDISNHWGNANEWLRNASGDGYSTGSRPRAGAIGVRGNHVVYVKSVHGNHVKISEMNYGWGNRWIQDTRTAPSSDFQYIY